MVRPSALSEAESAPMPLTVKSEAMIESGSIGSEKVRENVVGGVPVTIEPAAGVLEMTIGAITKCEIQVAQLAGSPERSDVEYSAPLQIDPSVGSMPMPL